MADHAGIMDMVENAPEVADLTPRVAKELVARFERCLTNNLQLRVRHAGDPMQFMDSEVCACARVCVCVCVWCSVSVVPCLLSVAVAVVAAAGLGKICRVYR